MVNIESNPLYYAAIGGLLIGIATSINYMLRGNVTGMSGMVYGTCTLDPSNLFFYYFQNKCLKISE